jgi:hypothetical protein
MSGQDKKEQIDADILQCKADVERSRNIKSSSEGAPQAGSPSQTVRSDVKISKEPSSLLAAVVRANKKEATRASQADIPSFDLAEEIMAQQRKITAIKRKRPGRKSEVRAGREDYERIGEAADYGAAEEISANEDLLIAEIVARDIERLGSGD